MREPDESLAELGLSNYTDDRQAEAAERVGQYLSDDMYPELRRRFGAATSFISEHGDPWPEILASIVDLLRPVIESSGPHTGDIDDLRFVVADSSSISAHYYPKADGSGIVEISTGILSISDLLARPFAAALSRFRSGSWWGRVRQAFEMSRQAPLDQYHQAVYATLIRYTLVHRMVLDSTGSLDLELDEYGKQALDALNSCKLLFIVAHEVSHHLLGHRSTAGTGDSTLCVAEHELEHEADALAISLVCATPIGRHLGVIGALLTFAATDYAERVLFVRNGRTHPPSAERSRRIRDRLNGRQHAATLTWMSHLDGVLDEALDLRSGLSVQYWRTLYDCPLVLTEPHSESYFSQMFELDQSLCAPLERHYEALATVDRQFGVPALSRGAELIRGGDVERGLRAWELRPMAVQKIAAGKGVLSFNDLRTSIAAAGRKLPNFPEVATLAVSVSGARVTQAALVDKGVQ